jgi:Lon protease-like protein
MLVPLFPLPNLVLLPGMVVPLYIFEPRYRELLARVRASGEPFGILRIDPAKRTGDPLGRIARAGTLVRLLQAEDHPDGTASISILAGERFRVHSFSHSAPYLQAEAELWPLADGVAGLEQIARELFVRYLGSLPAQEARQLEAAAPAGPLLLASYLALHLRLGPEQTESLLEADSLWERWQMLSQRFPVQSSWLN